MQTILTSPEFGAFVVNVLLALVAVVVPLIGTAVRGFVKSKENDTKFQMLVDIAKTAVIAAEQAGLAGVIEDKKAAALAYAQAMLADRGLSIDLSALDAAIEAAVGNELNRAQMYEASLIKAEALGAA